MGNSGIPGETKKIYIWLDNNQDRILKNNAAFYEAFPDKTRDALAFHKSQWKKKKAAGKWPESKQIESGSSQPAAPVQLETVPETVIHEPSFTPLLSEPGQPEIPSVISDDSKKDSINSFIAELYEHREQLFSILEGGRRFMGASEVDIRLKEPFKNVNFSMMVDTIEQFKAVCQAQGIPQRRAVHIAIHDFIQKFKSWGTDEGNHKEKAAITKY